MDPICLDGICNRPFATMRHLFAMFSSAAFKTCFYGLDSNGSKSLYAGFLRSDDITMSDEGSGTGAAICFFNC
jgi:hypothetical protein